MYIIKKFLSMLFLLHFAYFLWSEPCFNFLLACHYKKVIFLIQNYLTG